MDIKVKDKTDIIAAPDKAVTSFKKELINIPNRDYQDVMSKIKTYMGEHPDVVPGDFFPLKHTFAHGLYIRQVSVPAGYTVITFVHKQSHPAFLMQGDVTVVEDTGKKRIQAPMEFVTRAGTQRICACHTDTIWTTVHLNLENERDIDKIEKEIYADNYSELFIEAKEIKEALCQV